MTSLDYGLDMPYEVQLEHHAATSTTHMTILEPQRSPGQPATRHLLTPGVYMVSLAYNGAAAATLQHVGGGTTNAVSVIEGAAGSPRTSAPIKISVQGTTEYLHVVAPSTGGSARATISVIPAATFDEMAESAQGVSVLSEISNLKTTKADKSTLDARVPANMSLRVDTTVGTRIFSGNTMIHGDTGWRDVSPLFTFGWTGSARIRRVGNTIYLSINGLPGTDRSALPIPNGFRGRADHAMPAPMVIGNAVGYARITAGSFVIVDIATLPETGRDLYVTYHTPDPWPTTLPGLPG